MAASPLQTASNEKVGYSPTIDKMNARLAALKARVRIASAQIHMSNKWNGEGPTILVGKDRALGIGMEWVPGDPRRDGRVGVTYAFGSSRPNLPFVNNADLNDLHLATFAEVDPQIEEGMGVWRDLTCSSAPVTRVAPGTNPDFVDDLILGSAADLADYAQPADIIHSGWHPMKFFTDLFGEDVGSLILGVTFSFPFVDVATGLPTDIDQNRKLDLGVSEIYYNSGVIPANGPTPAPGFYWSNSGAFNFDLIDFFSLIGHESGHAFGLAHLGEVFVQKKDLADGLQPGDIKYAPYALMNAGYIAGRNDIANMDRTQFCWIWHD